MNDNDISMFGADGGATATAPAPEKPVYGFDLVLEKVEELRVVFAHAHYGFYFLFYGRRRWCNGDCPRTGKTGKRHPVQASWRQVDMGHIHYAVPHIHH